MEMVSWHGVRRLPFYLTDIGYGHQHDVGDNGGVTETCNLQNVSNFFPETISKEVKSLLRPEVLTKTEVYYRNLGLKKVDLKVTNMAAGAALGGTMLILAIGLVVGPDIPALKRDVRRRMIRNIKYWVKHLKHRH